MEILTESLNLTKIFQLFIDIFVIIKKLATILVAIFVSNILEKKCSLGTKKTRNVN